MFKGRIKRIIKIAKKSSKIIVSARNELLKNSLSTGVKLAKVYKNAGVKTFIIGKEVMKETLNYAGETQRKFFKTSREVIKETMDLVKQEHQREAAGMEKKDLSIDDLL